MIAALARTRNSFADASARCDEVAAEQEGRTITDADRDALETASAADQCALDHVLMAVPQSLAGIRALLEYSTGDEILSHEEHARMARNLLASPALAPGAEVVDRIAEPSTWERDQ